MSEVQNGKMGAVDFMNLIEDTFNTMLKLSDTKGAEYASDNQNQNRHENFDRAAVRMNLTPEQVLQVLLDKHITAIYTWISRVANPPKTEVVTSEPITGRIDDAILYLILLKGLYLRRLGVRENKIPGVSGEDNPSIAMAHLKDTINRKSKSISDIFNTDGKQSALPADEPSPTRWSHFNDGSDC